MARKPLCLRELRELRASLSSSGLLRAPLSRRVPVCSRKEENSHGGHGVHGGFDRYRACGLATFLISARHSLKRVQPIDQWLESLCVSVNSVTSVRAFLPPDSCAPPFHGGFRCVPGRRKTRTEVTVFTEGLTDTELAAWLPS